MAKGIKKIEISNKRARFNFHIEETYEAGMQLVGTEVKSIRNNSVNMGDGYCVLQDGELFLKTSTFLNLAWLVITATNPCVIESFY